MTLFERKMEPSCLTNSSRVRPNILTMPVVRITRMQTGPYADNQILKGCDDISCLTEIEEAVKNIINIWEMYTSSYPTYIKEKDKTFSKLIKITAKAVFHGKFSKEVHKLTKEHLQSVLESCVFKVDSYSQQSICLNFAPIIDDPWKSFISIPSVPLDRKDLRCQREAIINWEVKNVYLLILEHMDQIWNREGCLILEERLEILMSQKLFDPVAIILEIFITKGIQWYRKSKSQLNGCSERLEVFNFGEDKLMGYGILYVLIWSKSPERHTAFERWDLDFIKDVVSLLVDSEKPPNECRLFPKFKEWKNAKQIAIRFLDASLWNALKRPHCDLNGLKVFFEFEMDCLAKIRNEKQETAVIESILARKKEVYSSSYLYTLSEVVNKNKAGLPPEIARLKCIEVCVCAMMCDINRIEELKCAETINTQEILDCFNKLSERYIQMANVFKDHRSAAFHLILTAHSLHPQKSLFDRLFPQKTEYSLITAVDHRGIQESAETLGLTAVLYDDFCSVVYSPRVKTLCWSSREELKIICQNLIATGVKKFIEKQELAFVNVDFGKYSNLKAPVEIPYDDGVEKGYGLPYHSDDNSDEECVSKSAPESTNPSKSTNGETTKRKRGRPPGQSAAKKAKINSAKGAKNIPKGVDTENPSIRYENTKQPKKAGRPRKSIISEQMKSAMICDSLKRITRTVERIEKVHCVQKKGKSKIQGSILKLQSVNKNSTPFVSNINELHLTVGNSSEHRYDKEKVKEVNKSNEVLSVVAKNKMVPENTNGENLDSNTSCVHSSLENPPYNVIEISDKMPKVNLDSDLKNKTSSKLKTITSIMPTLPTVHSTATESEKNVDVVYVKDVNNYPTFKNAQKNNSGIETAVGKVLKNPGEFDVVIKEREVIRKDLKVSCQVESDFVNKDSSIDLESATTASPIVDHEDRMELEDITPTNISSVVGNENYLELEETVAANVSSVVVDNEDKLQLDDPTNVSSAVAYDEDKWVLEETISSNFSSVFVNEDKLELVVTVSNNVSSLTVENEYVVPTQASSTDYDNDDQLELEDSVPNIPSSSVVDKEYRSDLQSAPGKFPSHDLGHEDTEMENGTTKAVSTDADEIESEATTVKYTLEIFKKNIFGSNWDTENNVNENGISLDNVNHLEMSDDEENSLGLENRELESKVKRTSSFKQVCILRPEGANERKSNVLETPSNGMLDAGTVLSKLRNEEEENITILEKITDSDLATVNNSTVFHPNEMGLVARSGNVNEDMILSVGNTECETNGISHVLPVVSVVARAKVGDTFVSTEKIVPVSVIKNKTNKNAFQVENRSALTNDAVTNVSTTKISEELSKPSHIIPEIIDLSCESEIENPLPGESIELLNEDLNKKSSPPLNSAKTCTSKTLLKNSKSVDSQKKYQRKQNLSKKIGVNGIVKERVPFKKCPSKSAKLKNTVPELITLSDSESEECAISNTNFMENEILPVPVPFPIPLIEEFDYITGIQMSDAEGAVHAMVIESVYELGEAVEVNGNGEVIVENDDAYILGDIDMQREHISDPSQEKIAYVLPEQINYPLQDLETHLQGEDTEVLPEGETMQTDVGDIGAIVEVETDAMGEGGHLELENRQIVIHKIVAKVKPSVIVDHRTRMRSKREASISSTIYDPTPSIQLNRLPEELIKSMVSPAKYVAYLKSINSEKSPVKKPSLPVKSRQGNKRLKKINTVPPAAINRRRATMRNTKSPGVACAQKQTAIGKITSSTETVPATEKVDPTVVKDNVTPQGSQKLMLNYKIPKRVEQPSKKTSGIKKMKSPLNMNYRHQESGTRRTKIIAKNRLARRSLDNESSIKMKSILPTAESFPTLLSHK